MTVVPSLSRVRDSSRKQEWRPAHACVSRPRPGTYQSLAFGSCLSVLQFSPLEMRIIGETYLLVKINY